MLELRPNCENCNKPLPPDSSDAMICSYECTFCKDCALESLHNVCPNCGGGFTFRPIRPQYNHKDGNYLGNDPALTNVKYRPVNIKEHELFCQKLRMIPAEKR